MRASVKRLLVASLTITVVMSTAITFVKATASSKTAPQKSDSRSNLKQLGWALRMYTQDYDDVLPPMKDIATIRPLLAPYLEDKSAFINPDTKQPFLPNPSLSRRHLAAVYKESYQKKQGIVAFYEATPRANGARYVLTLPKPDGLNKRGEPFWKGSQEDSIIIVDSTGIIFPDFKVENISKRDWPKVKKASNIPSDPLRHKRTKRCTGLPAAPVVPPSAFGSR